MVVRTILVQYTFRQYRGHSLDLPLSTYLGSFLERDCLGVTLASRGRVVERSIGMEARLAPFFSPGDHYIEEQCSWTFLSRSHPSNHVVSASSGKADYC